MGRAAPSSKIIVACAAVLLGVVLVILQMQKEGIYRAVASRGIAVSGVILAETSHTGSRQRGRSWTEADVTYDVAGNTFTERIREGKPYRVGETIEMRYLPEDPTVIVDVEVLHDMNDWRSYMRRFGPASLFIGGGLLLVFRTLKRRITNT